MKKKNKEESFWKRNWIRVVFSVILGVISSAAYDYINTNDCHPSMYFLARAVILGFLYMGLFFFASKVLAKKDAKTKLIDNKVTQYLFGEKTPMVRQVLAVAGIILALWIPYFVVSYPGNLSNDTTGQIPMFFSMMEGDGEYDMTDQHPVFTTLVFGSIVYLGNMMFHDMQVAIAICIVLQMIVTAIVFGFAVVWMRRRWGTSVWLSIFSVIFLTICPVVPLMVVSLSKDTFFSWIYVLFVVAMFELVRRDFKVINNMKFLISLILVCIGVCLTKKLGVYIVAGTFLMILVFCKQEWQIRLKIAIPMVVSVVLMFVIMPAIIVNAEIEPSPTKEMLSVPLQQTAMTYIRHENKMADDEKARLNDLFELDKLKETYLPYASDPVKAAMKEDFDYKNYLGVWGKQLLKYPGTYVDAFATQISGLFVAYPIDEIFDNHWHTWNAGYFDESIFEKPDFSKEQSERLEEYYNWLLNTPILNMSTYFVSYVVFVPVLLLIRLIERKKYGRELLVIMPVAMSFAGLVVSGTVYYGNEAMRYVMPFVYTAPVLLAYAQGLSFRGVTSKVNKK